MYTILLVVTVFAGPTEIAVSSQQIGHYESRDMCKLLATSLTETNTIKDFGNSYWPIIKSKHATCIYIGDKQ